MSILGISAIVAGVIALIVVACLLLALFGRPREYVGDGKFE